eukprot:768715-Hanusia_phi.AAC.13
MLSPPSHLVLTSQQDLYKLLLGTKKADAKTIDRKPVDVPTRVSSTAPTFPLLVLLSHSQLSSPYLRPIVHLDILAANSFPSAIQVCYGLISSLVNVLVLQAIFNGLYGQDSTVKLKQVDVTSKMVSAC